MDIENFRGVSAGRVEFYGHALLVGPNNSCKSTVLEALDLALNPERGSGSNVVDEHDFHRGAYRPMPDALQAQIGPTPAIGITVTLGSLTEAEFVRFRSHVELWNKEYGRVCTLEEAEAEAPTPIRDDYVLRIKFNAAYEADEDEFETETVFLSPEGLEQSFTKVSRSDKRAIGFLYLRALRTARRAASLQRGSLLDVLMNLADAKPRFWEALRSGVGTLGETASADPNVRAILDDLERVLGRYLPRPSVGAGPSSRLNISRLTREDLRVVMTFFLASMESGHLLPFDRLGSGMTNILVLALLTLIAERKENVIFAMEEPEIALGPTVQRRIIDNLKSAATQALVTSHSPYVAEQMLPDQIVVLRRGVGGSLSSRAARATAGVKERVLRQDFRQKFAEGLVGSAVVIVEGVTEIYALPAASNVLAEVSGTAYRSLDLMGVVPVPAGGDGELAKVASFFSGAGIDTFIFCDKLNDPATRAAVQAAAKDVYEHPHRDFESILSKELDLSVLKRSMKALTTRFDYQAIVKLPADEAQEGEWRAAMHDLLKKRKAEGYAAIALKSCAPAELPISLRTYLGKLHGLASGLPLGPVDPVQALIT